MLKKPKKFYRKTTHTYSQEKKVALQAEKPQKNQLPKNNRSITETSVLKGEKEAVFDKKRSFRKKSIIIFLLFVSFFSCISIPILGVQAKDQLKLFIKIDEERKSILSKYAQWEQTAITHPGSRDVYLQLALLSYQLNDLKKANGFIDRAITLDPNYQPALLLKKKIDERK